MKVMGGRNPSFFKMILPCVHGDFKLRIPSLFMKKYGHRLPSSGSVHLQVPSGSIWEVQLMKYKGHHWLDKGWEEFAKYYSITYGYLLVFSFRGNSRFHVIILDTSASEIEYPVNDGARSIDDHEAVEGEDDFSFESLDGFATNTVNRRVKVEDGCIRSTTIRAKKRRNLDQCGLPQGRKSKRSRKAGPEKETKTDFLVEKSHVRTPDAKERALRRAEALECSGPSFIVQLLRSHLSDRFRVHIPVQHVREYLAGKHDRVVLVIGQGLESQKWPVNCYIHQRSSSLTTGWKKFASDNQLAVGDVCVFESIKANTYRVFIFRVADQRRGTAVKDSTVLPRRDKPFKNGNPSFRVVMRPSYIGRQERVSIPHHFHKYFAGKENKAVRLVHGREGKSWYMSYHLSKDNLRFHSGWSSFVRDNNLKLGDVCVFEMMDGMWNSYKVTILRS